MFSWLERFFYDQRGAGRSLLLQMPGTVFIAGKVKG